MEKNIVSKWNKDKILFKIIISLILLLIIFLLPKYSNKSFAAQQEESPEFVYLSDIKYSSAKVGWGKINLNGTDSNDEFSIKIEGGIYNFNKGIWAHASSEIVYNLTDYQDYDYFTTYIGVNTSSGNRGNGVKFYIYTSTDGKQWDLKTEENPQAIMSSNDAIFVKINIADAKFLKLVANDNGANGNDHSVYVDAKLIKETYKEPAEELVPSIEKLNQKIKTEFANANLETNTEYELTLLKRELINRVGNYALRKFLSESEINKETYTWLTSNIDVLRLYIIGGTPDGGNYYNSLTQLSRLYDEYKNDFTLTEKLNNKWYPDMTYGDLYKKMAISLSLTHSQNVGLWMQSGATENKSDALKRYAIYKYMHKNGKFKATDSIDITSWFEALQVEEMRFIMNNLIDDEDILWLNAYVQDRLDTYKTTNWLTPHPYMAYVWPDYGNVLYYNEENRQYFNELFAINKKDDNKGEELNNESGEKTGKVGLWDTKFIVPGGKNTKSYEISITRGTPEYKLHKVWMNFRNKFGTGAVCGGISKTGSNIRTTHGIPATVIGQPGHAALLYYTKDAEGRGYWNIDNDVSGWTLSEKGERLLLGWGNANTNYARGSYQVVYMALAQEAINDYENLVKCEELVYLADVYKEDLTKKEEIYRKALEIQHINVDAWLGLINVYNQSETKTQDEYFALTEEIAENLKYFPLPMQQLTNLIKPKLTTMGNEEQNIQNSYKFTLLQTRILTEGTKTPNNTKDDYYVYQPSLTRLEANFLLGKLDKTIATFSFDGEDAGKIVLSSRFDGNGIRFDYSLDGKQTWKEVSFTAEEEHKLKLTQEQINTITAENDIYVHIVGVNYDEENLYKIDITKGTLTENIYANDLENRIVGANLGMEWRYTENDNWISYSVTSPDLTGNKTVQIRQSATGTSLTSDVSPIYNFTEDNQPDTRKYIPVSHLSIQSVSTEAVNNGGAATNAIDANYNTRWHSAWNGSDTNRFIIIKLDKPVYLSAVEFVPAGGGNGRIVKGEVLGSLTGEEGTWVSLANNNDTPWSWPDQANDTNSAKTLTKSFEIPKENRQDKVQFVKIIAHQTNGNWFAARAFNFYQDLTNVDPHPTAGIAYSVTESTNGIVVARLINPSEEITITNNEGKDTYIFTKNGEFTFEFEDKNGNKGTATAKVTWIDKDEPTANINYTLDEDKKLRILLDNISEDVYLLDESNNKINYIEVNENRKITNIAYLDNTGNTYKILDKDEKGNTTKITYKNTTGTALNVATYITTIENGTVIKEEYFDNEGNPVTLEKEDQEALRQLQQTTRSNPLEYALDTSGEYEFKLLDKAENMLYKSIKVDYINNDTKILASDITYNITKLTNTDVEATLNPYIINVNANKDVDVIITSNGGNKHTFTENGDFTFTYKDASDENNLEVKEHKASVNWIDKKVPIAKITYSTTQKTNQEVIATISFDKENITVLGGNTHTFTKNGDYTFEFIDKAGNKGTAVASVDWIDKTAPTAEIKYSTRQTTNKAVMATLINESEEITITNNNGSKEYTFTKNGDFTFEFVDKAGNKGRAKAEVNWIVEEEKFLFTSDTYKIEEGYISNIRAGISRTGMKEIPCTTVKEFKENVKTNQELIFIDKDGNEVKDEAIVTTGMIIKVGNKMQYTLIVTGDIDQNGKISINDYANMKLHFIKNKELTGVNLKAADINCDNNITMNDAAKMKLVLVGLSEKI